MMDFMVDIIDLNAISNEFYQAIKFEIILLNTMN